MAGRKASDIPDVGWLLSPCPHKAWGLLYRAAHHPHILQKKWEINNSDLVPFGKVPIDLDIGTSDSNKVR